MATLETRLRDLATAIGTNAKSLKTLLNGNVSDLSSLATTAKNNLVAAINEVRSLAVGKQDALGFTPINAALLGANSGVATLDSGGKVPSAQLPAFVDDVLEYANYAALPGTGSTGIIYVTLDTNKSWRWSGSTYVEISASPGSTDAVTEGPTNLYFTNGRVDSRLTTQLGTYDTDYAAVFTGALV